jgi:cytochrome P450/ferredoxin-NADP reductase
MKGEPIPSDALGGGCPFHADHHRSSISDRAAEFDMFTGPYQIDPADALRWSRAEEPVFFSPKLGYWVVSRYDHVKAVFRDNLTFSPSIALEKMTPTCPEANAILKRYDYGMARTLVNEDEPAHTDRRRALMHSFTAAELAHHEPMVRRLTREYVDRFIDAGAADLVDEMLWEVPLTVALHFLGVPEDDMETLRKYSIAHTVNTWGRPTAQEQLAVAEAVGKFWQFAGGVLERMRANPDGHGWMQFAIRQQREMPDVVTDSYLHSMMMAGIVAAHETTAHASANAMRLLLSDRKAWDAICADPALIPNAVEECLRYLGSVVAWRRIATCDTRIGDVAIPAGAKLLIVSASANHDGRHFEDADNLDIYRDNTIEHLTFGYGSHQCMGKNLARMEMRIFVEEFAKRLPHMELVPDQTFTFLPNTSFRGPDHLLVRWDTERNPERAKPSILDVVADFPFGAPVRNSITRPMRVAEVHREAKDVLRLALKDPTGRDLPVWSPGAHIEIQVGDYVRKYSLCGNDPRRLEIAVLRESDGRGGSAFIHESIVPGATVRVRGPKNHFRLDEDGDSYLLFAGGIGITPIISMADRLKALGKPYVLHYAGRSLERMAFVERLDRDHGGNVRIYTGSDGLRLDVAATVAECAGDAQIYACGPERLLAAISEAVDDRPNRLSVERFGTGAGGQHHNAAFDVYLNDSGINVHVSPDDTLLGALRAAGIDVPSDCEEGLCGTCEVAILSGTADHRDKVLTSRERAANTRIMTCCSRALGGSLTLPL